MAPTIRKLTDPRGAEYGHVWDVSGNAFLREADAQRFAGQSAQFVALLDLAVCTQETLTSVRARRKAPLTTWESKLLTLADKAAVASL